MSSRDFYKVSYSNKGSDRSRISLDHDVLDNDTEFNANQFKLYDDFTTDLRINFNPLRRNFHDITRADVCRRRLGDPNDSGVDMENGNPLDDVTASNNRDLLENEVMVDPWSSMDSSNSPLTDSGPSASEDCTPSTSSEPPRGQLDASSPLSPDARRLPDPKDKGKILPKHIPAKTTDKARSRDLTLELETLEPDPHPRRPHFLDEDYQPPSKSNIECRIPKPHFLDHSPSPDEFDERSDITNPNFLDDEVDGDDNQAQKKAGALPKRPQKTPSSYSQEDRPHRTSYRSTLHYGLESAARSSERDKRASQLYRGTWPGERDVWTGHDSASVRSFSSNGSAEGTRPSSNLENKMECVCSLISLLSLSPENNADLSGPLLEMSRSVESCIAMRQAGCIPLLVQLIHSKVPRETRDRAAKALRNIIHTQTDDKAGRREARVWRLLEQVREYCYVLEDLVEARKEGKEVIEDDATKHPSQSVAALMKLSFDEEHRHVVCQLGGLQALAALVSGDQAAHGSRTDDNTCLTMRKYAGMTLTNLTFGDGNNKSLLCSFKDFMMALVEQLESPNDDMRQVTAAVLRNLSWRADTNSKQVLREVGAVKGLTKAAMTCQKEATLKSVLSALWNLTAHCSMNKVALCSVDGALGFLVDMLSYNSPTKTLAIVENAGGIMRNVSSHIAVREDYRQILRERNCLSVLLQHLKSPSLTVVSNSCGTLWNLSARCPQDQQFLWDHGAVPMLRSLIHSKHKMIAMGSSAALKNLLNSKPGKTHIISLDTTARNMNLPALPTLGARKQKALEQELDQNLAETCDNIEPATSPSTSNREEKNLFTATERQIAMNLERHRMTSSSPLMGTLTSQISLSHSAHLASYLSCSNTLLKGALVTRSNTGSAGNVNRSDSKDSVTSTHSDSVFERVMRTGKVPVPTPRNKDLMKSETATEGFKVSSKTQKDNFLRYPSQPPIPPPRSSTEMRTNYTESGFDVDQDSCDQPVDYSRKYSETKPEPEVEKPKADGKKYNKKESSNSYGDYQETDLDQPTDYSLRYAEHQSETGSDMSEPPGPSVHEDTIKHFATEGTPYETPAIFSTATSMSDLRVIGKDSKSKVTTTIKQNPEAMTHSDEKDTCSIEDPPRHDNDRAASTPQTASVSEPTPEKRGVFDTKFSSGMISPEKPVNYCDEGTPGYFSRVSSLSSLGEPTEEDSLAKRNAMATITVEPSPLEPSTSISAKDKEGSKAVTFATEPVSVVADTESSEPASARTSSPAQRFVEDTPLMFSRSSSLGSLPECSQQDDQGSVVSEVSRLTSGCVSPSEIPDSPGASAPLSPRAAHHRVPLSTISTPPQEGGCVGSVFEERVSRFVVEHTPAQFSAATSLSSLTIDDEPKQNKQSLKLLSKVHRQDISNVSPPSNRLQTSEQLQASPTSNIISNEPMKGLQTPGEVCKVYFTEDTPAILSKAGSNSNLSALSIESSAPEPSAPTRPTHDTNDAHDTSDSSNMSDSGDLLEECIQKGIAKVVKNKGPPSDVSSINPYRDEVYRSLPPYLRSSTETVRMSHEFARNLRDRTSALGSPPPPLPPKLVQRSPPPRPPPIDDAHTGRKPDNCQTIKSTTRDRPKPAATADLARNDSLSSLSLDSFGSTDREIFEETVKAGLSSVNPRAKYILDDRVRAHSAERVTEIARRDRAPRSLDRGDRFVPRHRDYEDSPTSQRSSRRRRQDREFDEPRGSHSYHGDSYNTVRARHDGPASLPGRVEDWRGLDRSASLSSLSNESFGSTDREVFERSVRIGMSRAAGTGMNRKRGRSDDRLESRRRGRRGDALARMGPARALLEEVIARGAGGRTGSGGGAGTKNVLAPAAAPPAAAVGRRPARGPGSDHAHLHAQTEHATHTDEPRISALHAHTEHVVHTNEPRMSLDTTGGVHVSRQERSGIDNNIGSIDTAAGIYGNHQEQSNIVNNSAPLDTVAGTYVNQQGRSDIDNKGTSVDTIAGIYITHKEQSSIDNNSALLDTPVGIYVNLADFQKRASNIDNTDASLENVIGSKLDSTSNDIDNIASENVISNNDVIITQSPISTLKSSVTMTFSTSRIVENVLESSSPNEDSITRPPFRLIVEDVIESNTKINEIDVINELPTIDSENTTLDSINIETPEITRSNECLAPRSVNTTLESEPQDELNRSNESYADVLDGSWSDGEDPAETKQEKAKSQWTEPEDAHLEWTDIKYTTKHFEDLPVPEETSKKSTDTWNDNTCPDDVTFPTISGSVHMVSSIKSEIADHGMTLPDLLEKSEAPTMSFSRPDLTNRLDRQNSLSPQLPIIETSHLDDRLMLDSIPEPTFASLVDDGEQKFDSILSAAIEKEAARLAAQLKNSQYAMEASVTSLTSLDLDNVKPPSNLGSLLSLSASGQWDESSQMSKKSQKSRKKSLPVSLMVKRALSNSMHQGSSEHLDSNPVSFLDNVKPPSEMENIDMEGSMISVSSIVSEVAEVRERTPIVFDFKQPIQDFPLCNTFTTVFHDLDKVNPPSLFDEIAESTLEIEQTTAQHIFDDCVSNTLNIVTDIPSGSENCTPLPSDMSSVESTPKRQRDPNYLTPKEKRHVSKDRYQTYTITDTVTETDVVLEVEEEFVTWTKSESDRSDEYVTATSEVKSRRKLSAKQRRLEDRARYQTQTVDIHNILSQEPQKTVDPHIESLKRRLAAKKSIKQKRLEDAERFRTRTLSEDIPPSPTFVTKDANFENVETTTGYDSLSSNELNHQQISDDRQDDDVFSRDVDSGHNEDDFELNSTQMQTYTKSFRNYLPVIESPAAVDMCVVNNLKNIEMTASYRRTMQMQSDKNQNPSSSDFASYEGDSNSEDKAHSESDPETPRPKPKIIKPARRDESLDSNDSLDKEQDCPKAIRGRKKAMYVSPYRRNTAAPKKPAAPQTKTPPKSAPVKSNPVKAHTSAKIPKPPASKTPSANTSPKKSLPRSPTKAQTKPINIPLVATKPISIPPVATKPLPLERQGTFTKEESSIPAKDLPVLDKKPSVPRLTKGTPTKNNTSPSRLPQYSRSRPPVAKTAQQKPPTKVTKKHEPVMKNSPSNHSLQSNESGKTITIASRSSRQGSTSSINSGQSSKANSKDVESKIASLWKKVEQAKKLPAKAEKKVWIEADKTEPPKLIRSSTFEGQPKAQVSTTTKQKSAIGIRVSQIPSLRPKTSPTKAVSQVNCKKPNTRVFARKPNGQITS